MRTLPWMRILSGGLLAGVFNVFAGVLFAHLALGDDYVAGFKAVFANVDETEMLISHVGLRLLLGLTGALLFALVSHVPTPRWSAVCWSGLVLWAASTPALMFTLRQLGVLVGWRFGVTAVWTLIEATLTVAVAAVIVRGPVFGSTTVSTPNPH